MEERRATGICTMDIVLISASRETSVTTYGFVAQNCTDNQYSKLPAGIVSNELDRKETTINDGHAYREFESDDSFFSVGGEFTPSCSNSSSRQQSLKTSPELKKTGDSKQQCFLQEPSLRNSIDDLHVYKDIKLAEFFQDRYWKGEIACIHSSPPIASVRKENGSHNLPQKGISGMPRQNPMFSYNNGNPDLQSKSKDEATHCCMPCWTPCRGSKEKGKPYRTWV